MNIEMRAVDENRSPLTEWAHTFAQGDLDESGLVLRLVVSRPSGAPAISDGQVTEIELRQGSKHTFLSLNTPAPIQADEFFSPDITITPKGWA